MDAADNNNMINDAHKLLFCKMIDMAIRPATVKKVMSLWMFMESINGFRGFCQSLLLADRSVMKCLCAEAEISLAFLESETTDNVPTASNPNPAVYCPNTWLVSRLFSSPNDFFEDKRRASDQIMAIRTNVCNVAFEDILEMKGLKSPSSGRTAGEGTPAGIINPNNNETPVASQLNPAAEEWSPASVPEHQRSLFMTFSKGYPLSKAEIVTYFQRVYGDCVEEVYIHKPRGGSRVPEFGKIVFKYALITFLILQNQEFIIYRIGDQKTIGLKRYRPAA